MSYFFISQDTSPSAAPVPRNIQFQFPYALPLGTSSIQHLYDIPRGATLDPYFPLENPPNPSPTTPPRTATVSYDNNMRNYILPTDFSDFGLMQPSMFPVIPQVHLLTACTLDDFLIS